jgi:isopenicillin-N epimerase
MRERFALEQDLVFLNHGSFGACPRAVLARQAAWRAQLEQNPVEFLARRLEPRLDEARQAVGTFVGAAAEELAFVTNATGAVNTVLQALHFEPGDELLTTSHGYNACLNALRAVCARSGARLVVAQVPFPLESPEQVTQSVLSAVTPRTRLALLDHVTSATAVIFPVEVLVPRLEALGVMTLVDGAHAPGQVPLSLRALGASFYTGNLHKWVCAPKGAAFLHVRGDRQALVRPLVVSHGANSPRVDRSRFHLEFDWVGTQDPTAFLCVPEALAEVGAMSPGGWPGVMAENHALVLEGRARLLEALGGTPLAPPELLGGDGDAHPARPRPTPARAARQTSRRARRRGPALRLRRAPVPAPVGPALQPRRGVRVARAPAPRPAVGSRVP